MSKILSTVVTIDSCAECDNCTALSTNETNEENELYEWTCEHPGLEDSDDLKMTDHEYQFDVHSDCPLADAGKEKEE